MRGACGICLDLSNSGCGFGFHIQVPDGAEHLTVTVQAAESGDDADDHPPPSVYELDGPITMNIDLGDIPI